VKRAANASKAVHEPAGAGRQRGAKIKRKEGRESGGFDQEADLGRGHKMAVTEQFKDDSAKAAIRALRGLMSMNTEEKTSGV